MATTIGGARRRRRLVLVAPKRDDGVAAVEAGRRDCGRRRWRQHGELATVEAAKAGQPVNDASHRWRCEAAARSKAATVRAVDGGDDGDGGGGETGSERMKAAVRRR
ncbi:hypothetical protein Scep_011627 [Stephania cephalantha]|uniref:Uncharacterized protein n=1 Tax=Stephania cephalantha TaxID=152367 RepID=A0AAP0P6N9_9MAGN